jgi:hypothetical protein
MSDKRVHKPNKDKHNEKEARENLRQQRETAEVDEALRHRSNQSVVEGGQDEQRGEPPRHGHLTPKGPRPLENK